MPSVRVAPLLAALVTATATFWLGCGGGGSDLAAPELGTLDVVTATAGPEPDADGYTVSIDGAAATAIAINSSVRQTDVAAGSHTVELSGVAANCTVSTPLQLSVSVAANAVTTATFAITCVPTTGTIQVTTTSSGTPADADGYRLLLDGIDTLPIDTAATVTIAGVAPGDHTIGLAGVATGCELEGENPLTVTVAAGQTAGATMAVICTPPAPESGTLAVVTQTSGNDQDPDGYTYAVDGGDAQPIGANATINILSLAAGSHTVTLAGAAANCTVGGSNPRSVSVPNGGTGQATFSVTCTATSASLDLRVDGWQLTQSVQSDEGDVPLVTSRDGYIRVFVLSNEANTAAPSVRVRLYRDGALTGTLTIPAPGSSTPTRRDEGRLASSWNVKIPREIFTPGLAVLADVDPDNTIVESDETNNAFPHSGQPEPQDVRNASVAGIRFVPVKQSANGLQGDVSSGNKSTFLDLVRQLYPLPGADGDTHAVYTTTSGALQPDDGNGAWVATLGEIDALRVTEGTDRTYFGVVRLNYGSGVAGLGYIGAPAAIGYDNPFDKSRVVAHELGHTWGRLHSPCGNPTGSVDPHYPYPGGVIGVYGLELRNATLKDPSVPDIMGYCGDPWVSDYTYEGIQAYRAASGAIAASSAPAQRCLLIWGHVVDGRAVLEPAFEVVTRPSLPKQPGAYAVEGLAGDGARLFNLSFDAVAVADDPR
ncbi:MAG: CARDB domain-containing protein, partial [Gemmatimonadales bacterium]